MSFCNKCGSNINPNEKFCPKCGNRLAINEFVAVPNNNTNHTAANSIHNPVYIKNQYSNQTALQHDIKPKKDRTRFWLIMKLVVMAIFIASLFFLGMFKIDYESTSHISNHIEEYEYTPSFFYYSNYYLDFGSSDICTNGGITADKVPQFNFPTILFNIIAAVIILEIVFSIIRILKFKYVKINNWQLILPILIFLLFITSSVSSYFSGYHNNRIYTYEFTYTDSVTGEIYQYTDTFTQKMLDSGFATPETSVGSDTTYKLISSEIYHYNFGPIFYLAIAIYIFMIIIDCYTIKKVKFLQKQLQ